MCGLWKPRIERNKGESPPARVRSEGICAIHGGMGRGSLGAGARFGICCGVPAQSRISTTAHQHNLLPFATHATHESAAGDPTKIPRESVNANPGESGRTKRAHTRLGGAVVLLVVEAP